MAKDEKKPNSLKITGRFVDRATKTGAAGLRVEAWDKELAVKEALGSAVTDAKGSFQIELDEPNFRKLFQGRKPQLFFKVFQDSRLIQSTENSVLWIEERAATEIVIERGVDQPKPDPTERREVKGKVLFADGSPSVAIGVTLFNRDLRQEQQLGQGRTDEQGRYQLIYTNNQRKTKADSTALVVKAFSAEGSLLAASQPLFDPPAIAVIDLTISAEVQAAPPLFEKIGRAIGPLLENLKLEDLKEDENHSDISFLAGRTGLEKTVIARYVIAHKLAHKLRPAEFWFALLGESFFQFVNKKSLDDQLKSVTDSLSLLDAAAVRKALARAATQSEIAKTFSAQPESLVENFLQFVASEAFAKNAEPSFLKSAVEHAGISDPKKQEKFARLFNEHKALTPELLTTLERDKSFKKGEVADLLASFQLAELTQADFSVVKTIKEQFGIRRPEEIRKLAKKSSTEWIEIVKPKLSSGEIKLPVRMRDVASDVKPPDAEIFGKTLERQFREAFPTTAFAGGLDRAVRNGGTRGFKRAKDLAGFLERHEAFDLLRTSVDEFLKNDNDGVFETLSKDEEFVQELKAGQRLFKVAPTMEATDALLADGLHSAQQIYRLGESQFVQRYGSPEADSANAVNAAARGVTSARTTGMTSQEASAVWNRAADTHAAAITITGELSALDPNSLPQALQIGSGQALAKFPNWENLFQAGDLCDCKACRSVLSPAAYFADLLMYLKDRKAANQTSSVKDLLFIRRPDLGYLELNCENALTMLPYIDIVNEVLEAAIAADENDVELIGLTSIPDDSTATKNAVASTLQAANLALGGDFSLSQVNPLDFDRWVVHGESATYLLKKKTTANFYAEVLRNTKAKAEELRALPQYINPHAYDKLRQARYPLALPFDLFGADVRATMKKANLQRSDLMEIFRGPQAPNNPSDDDIAAEYFGISVDPLAAFDESRLILLADVAGQQALWGEALNANWLDATGTVAESLCIVKNFLQKTGLDYNELLALLDLEFIDQAGDISVHHLDDSCDTAKKVIAVLDGIKLDRIHRFLRLWRKLEGWKLWELDLVIRQPNVGNGQLDVAFLKKLFYFDRLKKRLGRKASVEQVCALFDNLNTGTHFTESYEPRDDALYQQLFLNGRLIKPLDPAFELDPTGQPASGQTIAAHRPVVAAALGLREPDLMVLEQMQRASTGLAYLDGQLTLSNLSFLWRHAWLAKLLKFKTDEWKLLLKLEQQDVPSFADPKAAWNFVEQVDQIRKTGFTLDELNWLLAADRSAQAAVKESEAARFLSTLRNTLQKIKAENDPAQFGFLTAAQPTDEAPLDVLLTKLLQQLSWNDQDAKVFLAILRGPVKLEAAAPNLPAVFTSFPPSIIGAPNHIPIDYDATVATNAKLVFTGRMSIEQRDLLLTDASLAAVTNDASYQIAIADLFQLSLDANANFATTELEVSLPGALILPVDGPSIPIQYDAVTQRLSFTGIMTLAERNDLISAGNPAGPIKELFKLTRLAVKFFAPSFTAPLAALPQGLDFKTQLPAELAGKISYDPDQRLLRFDGVMTDSEQVTLDAGAPVSETAYHAAVTSLFSQPRTIAPSDERVWLTDAELDASLPANDTLAKRLATAAARALNYLSRTLAVDAVIQQSSAQLKLTEAMTRLLLTQYAIIPPLPNKSLLEYLTQDFAVTTGTVGSSISPMEDAFNGWFWANRIATLWRKWKIRLEDWERLAVVNVGLALNHPGSLLTDARDLPLIQGGSIAPIDRFLRTSRLVQLRDSLPQTSITFLEVLEKLATGVVASAADLAADVQLLNEDWTATDMFINAITTAFNPADYLLAENWERLRKAHDYLDSLGAGADAVKVFAAPAMTDAHARTLRDLLRTEFGTETWLTLSTEIQDVLREQKRNALAAFLLTQPPANPPSKKWENTNDLYAFYLLDVEMSSCQLTSRLVSGTSSILLFGQRCFMGLEPDVEVHADGPTGDSAWRWWSWMDKYQVWKANRKVFLWPENWLEPELRDDRSQFFREMENELLQNDINQPNVETAFANYLEKLDGVAQLEIAGFYQEDDGDNAIVHIFGRTKGADPHVYYYRRYDYYQYTPWEKVDLDIHGDYLIPAVIERRLFLFWPVFTEVPDELANSTVQIPQSGDAAAPVKSTQKMLKLQMAVSEKLDGSWRPKRISNDFALSDSYDGEITRKHYRFIPVDRSEIDGRFAIKYFGYSLGRGQSTKATLKGAFEIAGCRGVPELTTFPGYFRPAIKPERPAIGDYTHNQKWLELAPPRFDTQNDFWLETFSSFQSGVTPLLTQTPGLFAMSPPWHLSYIDKLVLDGQVSQGEDDDPESPTQLGSLLPFFYNDQKRTFFVLPTASWPRLNAFEGRDNRKYYPELKKLVRQWEDQVDASIQSWLREFNLRGLSPQWRADWEQFLHRQLREERNPSYSDSQFKQLLRRYFMQLFHSYLGLEAMHQFRFQRFHFKNFYHPFVCDFLRKVYNPLEGIPALMSRETQLQDSGFSFRQSYTPTYWVVNFPHEDYYPKEVVDFTPDGAYSSYNWELFFHAPLMIANALSKSQSFEKAQDWYHFIFNPIGVESPTAGGSAMSKYWITKPFFLATDPDYVAQRIDNILGMLAGNASPDLDRQVLDWRNHPFKPHHIASYRTTAHQKNVVMKYLDNLISWGDHLFAQDSMESINEATQLYVLAAELLGPPHKKIPPRARPPLKTFNEMENGFDSLSNAIIQVENLVPPMPGTGNGSTAPLPMLYFCIPHNEKMLGYWNTVADRLYKIRHCMNIEGVVRQLALFEPEMDPAMLVKAAAGGVDIGSALDALNAPLPIYRFSVLLQKANEVCNDLKALGGALLAALEKKDAEALSLLRQSEEIRLLEAVRAVREQQIEEAKENLVAVKKSKVTTETRRNYYRDIERLSTQEKLHLDKLTESHKKQEIAQGVKLAGSIIALLPGMHLGASGFGGSPHAKISLGGLELGQAASIAGDVISFMGQIAANDSIMASSKATFDRRWEDWQLQRGLAERELDQIESQIAAAQLRVELAKKELANHNIQIEKEKTVDAYMRSKYTNLDLCRWQIGKISDVYFQSYKLAYDLAKRAERCFRFELGLQDSSYISFGYWDSLKKGLLSGDKLQYDLRRLETAYLDQNRREFELTKHISLALLNPLALIKLRETGRCFFQLPESLFDLDSPGHYFRRIKSVSLTLPCITGPYTTISCTLRLLNSNIRIDTDIRSDIQNGYARNEEDGLPADDSRFVENKIAVKAIAASSAQNDSGLFELNFSDDRYLPFEGAGAVSSWSLELFTDSSDDFGAPLRQFDYTTISDAVLHLRYTSREDAGQFKQAAIESLRANLANEDRPFLRVLDLRQEFPSQWHRFLTPQIPGGANVFEFELSPNLFPFRDAGKSLTINSVSFLARCTGSGNYEVALTLPASATFSLAPVAQYGGLHFGQQSIPIDLEPDDPPTLWKFTMTGPSGGVLTEDTVKRVMEVEHLVLVLGYAWK